MSGDVPALERGIGGLLERPVGVSAFYLLVVALAAWAVARLPLTLLPSVAFPSLVVWTALPDVPPERVERAVTRPVEEALAGLPGSTHLFSRSQLGGSLVRADFGWNVDLDLAALEARRQLDRLAGLLPEEADRPLVMRVDPAERPILVLALGPSTSDGPDGASDGALHRLGELARETVARRLEQLEGVARVRVTGGRQRWIEVRVRPAVMAAYGLTVDDLASSLARSNVALAGGSVRRGALRYAVEVSGELDGPEAVAAAVVSPPGRPIVRLRDVAEVAESSPERRGLVRLDGRECLLLLVERRPDANTLETVRRAHRAIEDLRARLPGVRLDVVIDEAVFVARALSGVVAAIVVGGLLAVAVLWLFLRRPRATLAVTLALPLSLALTLVLLDLLGVSIHLLTLSGLALGVGMLVDNSIVIVENVTRLREGGMPAMEAARRGSAQVAGAITGSTLTTLAVFLPLRYVDGLAGRLFADQSLAVACSLLASLVVALTAVPLLAARAELHAERLPGAARPGFGARSAAVYEGLLEASLRRRGAVLLLALAGLGAAAWLAAGLPREALPATHAGRLQVRLEMPPGTELEHLSAAAARVEEAARGWPGVRRVLADLGERDDARLELDPRPPYRADLILELDPAASGRGGPAAISARLAALASAWTAEAGKAPQVSSLLGRRVPTRLESLLSRGDGDLWVDVALSAETSGSVHPEPTPPSGAPGASIAALLAELGRRPELRNVGLLHGERLAIWRLHLDREALLRHGLRADELEA
ncbi:MAG: efflux RND transporter permease subunit, partial [Holophagales bacterium]|nr:efflux RND transporter permease subunit [Holophagales bacterium]